METFKRTPLQLFNMPQRFVVPLFQRAYVWRQDEQWEPFWKDVARTTELAMTQPHVGAQHFLGAVVLQAGEPEVGQLAAWNVIDGQQRLTTLQLLADATCAVLSEHGLERLANQVEGLTHNSANFVEEGDSRLKLHHLNNDHAAFVEVMTAEPPVDYAELRHCDERIVQAHAFFTGAVNRWLEQNGPDAVEPRAAHLARVLLDGLQLVTIELQAKENSQEIFETLNARGTPLTAADLIRNFVFQRLESEGADTRHAYHNGWPFEGKFWTKEVSVGRYLISRSSLFFNQWLIARTGEEISTQSTFTRFKSYVEHDWTGGVSTLLPQIKAQADQYQAWTEAAARTGGHLNTVEMAVYRMRASGTEILKPLLLWLHEPTRVVPPETIDEVVRAAESWVVRRQLLRLPTSDLGRIVADLIRDNSGVPVEELGTRVPSQLARLNSVSTYWPGDDELSAALRNERVYRRFPRSRTRMYLEAIEDHYRARTGQSHVDRQCLPIEHVLPQKWEDHWPVESPEARQERQDRVHRLGNLTLLTTSLNAKVSNSAWPIKRRGLLGHNTMNLTGRIIADTEDQIWDEVKIDQRTTELVQVLLSVWPVPAGHRGEVVDPSNKAQEGVDLKQLIAAGMLVPGIMLRARHRDHHGVQAELLPNGSLQVNGKVFETPSGAGRHLRRRETNGWQFWEVPDGRRLSDVRAEYVARRWVAVEPLL